LFAGDVNRRPNLVRFANWLVQDRGILTVADLVVGNIDELGTTVEVRRAALNRDIDGLGIVAFGEVDIVASFADGAVAVAQANGIAGIASNTVMFGWSDKAERRADVLRIIERLAGLGISAVICDPHDLDLGPRRRRIDVWWGGLQQNGDMLALLAHLLSLDPAWRDAHITLKSIATSEMVLQRNQALLDTLMRTARIRARAEVFLKPPDLTVMELIAEQSTNADAVLMGLRSVKPGEEADYAARLEQSTQMRPSVLFVRSAGEFRGRLLGDQPQTAGRGG
jgi:hypothetical protein